MAIPFPGSLGLKRNKAAERMLVEKARKFIESGDRTPGIHASDLLDELQAFYKHTSPSSLPDRLVNTFLVGKVLHAFVLQSIDDRPSVDLGITDDGSSVSDLGFSYSPDKVLRGMVRELKTSRSFYEPKTVRDLDSYIEQVLVYMAAEKTIRGQIWVLYLNFRDKEKKTAPAFRTFDVTISEEDLAVLRTWLAERTVVLADAIKRNDPTALPLCREWKCGRGNCDFYDKCKPDGRYGTKRFDGKAVGDPEPDKEPQPLLRVEEAEISRPRKAGVVASKQGRGRKGKPSAA